MIVKVQYTERSNLFKEVLRRFQPGTAEAVAGEIAAADVA